MSVQIAKFSCGCTACSQDPPAIYIMEQIKLASHDLALLGFSPICNIFFYLYDKDLILKRSLTLMFEQHKYLYLIQKPKREYGSFNFWSIKQKRF